MTELEVTDSYLGLEQDVKGCQSEEPYLNCTTKHYIENILVGCGCLPFNIRQGESKQVFNEISII